MKYLLLLVAILFSSIAFTQNCKPWQGKKCAVVLTYDDAIDQHLDNAVPVLDSLGLKATFYLTAFSASMQNRMGEWRQLADVGHELGNHTLNHPCIGGPGREWVKPEYDLNHYTVKRMLDETRMTNLFLKSLDGQSTRTFAFTCGDMKIHDTAFINYLKDDFIAARAVRNEMHPIDQVDLMNVDCYLVNHHSADEMIAWVKQAMEKNALLVILFHGVGGGNGLDVSLEDHRRLLIFLQQHAGDIMITPMRELATHVIEYRKCGSSK